MDKACQVPVVLASNRGAESAVRRRQHGSVSVRGKLSFPLFTRQLRLRSSDDRSVNGFFEGGDAVDEFDAQVTRPSI
jgi:hypothetical protein